MRMSTLLATAVLLQACGSSGSNSGSGTSPSSDGSTVGGSGNTTTPVVQNCSGEVAQGNNLVVNGDFTTAPDQVIAPGGNIDCWSSGYQYMGLHPTALLGDGQIAAYTGFLNFPLVKQKQFEGDPDNGVDASTHYLFSDGGAEILTVWRQTVEGLQVGSRYAFTVYASNVLVQDWKKEPIVSLRVNGEELLSQLIEYDGLNGQYVPSQDKWTRVSVSFVATDEQLVLEIVDTQPGTVNDLAITAVSLKQEG